MTMTLLSLQLQHLPNSKCLPIKTYGNDTSLRFYHMQQLQLCNKFLLFPSPQIGKVHKYVAKPISAVGSGMEASITDPKDNVITVKNAKIVVESEEDNKIQLRVDLTGDETLKVFNKVLTNLARTAPPIPGFRREKGGKTTKVPRDFLLQILGEEHVTNFVIQEIVSSTMADYVKKENLKVKDNKINTTQKEEELKKLFTPGKEFGFNAVVELQQTETETEMETETEASS